MAAARAQRVDHARVVELLLAPSVPSLHTTLAALARDGLAAEWAAVVDRGGSVLAGTGAVPDGRALLLAALTWGAADDTATLASPIAGLPASLVVGRRTGAFGPGERERLGVLAGMAAVVWGHLGALPDEQRPASGG